MMSLYPPTEISEGYTMEDVDEKYVLSDGARNLEIYYVQGLASHVDGMLMAYLPSEKLLIEADLYDRSAAKTTMPALTEVHQTFYNNVQQIGLDVAIIVPIHGQPVPWGEFREFIAGGNESK